jgi:hypothetical protein
MEGMLAFSILHNYIPHEIKKNKEIFQNIFTLLLRKFKKELENDNLLELSIPNFLEEKDLADIFKKELLKILKEIKALL